MPDRLKALLAEPAAQVVDLGAVRAQRRGMSNWMAWGGMAATLVMGTLIGMRLTPPGGSDDRLVASGAIAYEAVQRFSTPAKRRPGRRPPA